MSSLCTPLCNPLNLGGLLRSLVCGFAWLFLVSAGYAQTTDGAAATPEVKEAQEPKHTDVRPSSFQEITPGKTTREELVDTVGEPKEALIEGDEEILVYSLGPFPRVEMIVSGEVVDSIVVHMATATPPKAVAEELGLKEFVATTILGPDGDRMGQVYPERGVAFSFVPDENPALVGQLILEPISAEFFLLRAKDDSITNYEQKVADLNYVLSVDPKNSVACWLKARLYAKARYDARALANVERALETERNNPRYRLLRAELRSRLGQHTSALHDARFLAAQKHSDVVRAEAAIVLGDLLANGPKRDYPRAMEQHLAAIKLVAPLVASESDAERARARELLIRAHLAVAKDVTHGEWSGKNESAPEWLKVAKELTDQYLTEDNGDAVTRLQLLQQALACYVGMRGVVDPADVAQESQEFGEQLLSTAKDDLRRREIIWLMADALVETVQIEQMRGQPEKVVEYTAQAEQLLEQLNKNDDSKRKNDVLGRLYFLTGTTFAVHSGEHREAIHWYERCLPHLAKIRPPNGSLDLVRHGQRFISIGVSYWEVGNKAEAIRLTESGLRIMTTAIETGKLDAAPLTVPYGNLAAMYRSVGRESDAQRLADRATRVESEGRSALRR